jgi:hypothetical protein
VKATVHAGYFLATVLPHNAIEGIQSFDGFTHHMLGLMFVRVWDVDSRAKSETVRLIDVSGIIGRMKTRNDELLVIQENATVGSWS